MKQSFNYPDNISRRSFLNKSVNGIKLIALGSFTVALINACSNNSNPASPNGNSNAKITVDYNRILQPDAAKYRRYFSFIRE